MIFSKGLKNKFKTAVVNESSVFEPLKSTVVELEDNIDSDETAHNDPLQLALKSLNSHSNT